MAAFLIVDVTEVNDEAVYSEYRKGVPPKLATHGGTYLARGGAVVVLEGSWRLRRIVVVQFDSVEAARKWWHDPAYCELKTLRQRSTTTNMILVEGVNHEQ